MTITSRRSRKYLNDQRFMKRYKSLWNKIYVTGKIKVPVYNFSTYLIDKHFPELK